MSKKAIYQKPVFWVGVVALAVVGYTMTGEKAGTAKSKVPPKKRTTIAKKGAETFTEEDQTASFDRVQVTFKNAFVPLVAKSGGVGGADGQANAIPASFSGGDGSWVFTGSVEVDGVRQALLENRRTNDGVFLRAGQRWKNCVVKRVYEDSVVIEGPSGEMTFGLVNEEKLTGRMASNSGMAPMRVDNPPNFRGDIGGGRGLPGVTGPGGGFNAVPQGGGAVFSTDEAPIAIPLGGQ